MPIPAFQPARCLDIEEYWRTERQRKNPHSLRNGGLSFGRLSECHFNLARALTLARQGLMYVGHPPQGQQVRV